MKKKTMDRMARNRKKFPICKTQQWNPATQRTRLAVGNCILSFAREISGKYGLSRWMKHLPALVFLRQQRLWEEMGSQENRESKGKVAGHFNIYQYIFRERGGLERNPPIHAGVYPPSSTSRQEIIRKEHYTRFVALDRKGGAASGGRVGQSGSTRKLLQLHTEVYGSKLQTLAPHGMAYGSRIFFRPGHVQKESGTGPYPLQFHTSPGSKIQIPPVDRIIYREGGKPGAERTGKGDPSQPHTADRQRDTDFTLNTQPRENVDKKPFPSPQAKASDREAEVPVNTGGVNPWQMQKKYRGWLGEPEVRQDGDNKRWFHLYTFFPKSGAFRLPVEAKGAETESPKTVRQSRREQMKPSGRSLDSYGTRRGTVTGNLPANNSKADPWMVQKRDGGYMYPSTRGASLSNNNAARVSRSGSPYSATEESGVRQKEMYGKKGIAAPPELVYPDSGERLEAAKQLWWEALQKDPGTPVQGTDSKAEKGNQQLRPVIQRMLPAILRKDPLYKSRTDSQRGIWSENPLRFFGGSKTVLERGQTSLPTVLGEYKAAQLSPLYTPYLGQEIKRDFIADPPLGKRAALHLKSSKPLGQVQAAAMERIAGEEARAGEKREVIRQDGLVFRKSLSPMPVPTGTGQIHEEVPGRAERTDHQYKAGVRGNIQKQRKNDTVMEAEEINLIAERVFKVLEKRIAIQRDRRGLS